MDERIFICDDEEGMRRYLTKMFGGWGFQAQDFANPLLFLKLLEETDAEGDLLLLDIKMEEIDGIEVLRRVRKLRPQLPVVMMTGHGTIESAVEAIKLGAWDYLTKPFPQEKLFAQVQHVLEAKRLREENQGLRQELQEKRSNVSLVFRSPLFAEAYEMALTVADSPSSILITGESGTGKELIAATIHNRSPRAARRFLAVNCAALTETLLESQLFGHVRGAFTGAVQAQKGLLEEAHGGTLFLDEAGELSPPLQAKLLRVLQEGEFIPVGSTRHRKVDVRFLAATNRDLEAEVRAGRFREDLFYRLNVITLHLPPLRERPEDIEPLARHFLEKASAKTGRRVRRITQEALAALQRYEWPGNVRELENAIERGVILARGEEVTRELLPLKVSEGRPAAGGPAPPAPLNLREAEALLVGRALEQTGWNKSQAAALLGVTRKTLDRKIREYELTPGSPA